jgi:hypothetical protein
VFLETPVGAGAGNIGPGANGDGAVKKLTHRQKVALMRSLLDDDEDDPEA